MFIVDGHFHIKSKIRLAFKGISQKICFNLGNFCTPIPGSIAKGTISEITLFFRKGDRKVDVGFKLTSVLYAIGEIDGRTRRVV